MDTLVAEYRRLQRLIVEGQHGPGRTRTLGWDLEYLSLESVLGFIDFILHRRMNDFAADGDAPVILDCGANVGYTVLHYKRLYPAARITAFEPDPEFSGVLRRNLERNGAADVDLVNAAVWTSRGRMPWVTVGTDGSRVVADGAAAAAPAACCVATVDLLEYLDREIDLLKIDIEGAEFEVVPHLAPGLHNVRNILVECHLASQASYAALTRVVATLQDAGFTIALNTYGPWRDLTRRHEPAAWHAEQYMLVAGWRSSHPRICRDATIAPYAGIAGDLQIARLEEVLRQAEARHRRSLLDIATGRRSIDVLTLSRPFRREHGFCWMARCPDGTPGGDSGDVQGSSLVLLENDTPLGPAHTAHDEIRSGGGGRYSHWGSHLYLSTSDNSDPNRNGRDYRVVVQREARP